MVTIPIAGLLIAGIGGAAIGLERQWSGHATGPRARFGGIRTFTLLGGLGGAAGTVLAAGWTAVAAAMFAAPAALVVAAYVAGSRDDIDGTTEVAALVVLTAGVLSGAGQTVPASAVVAVTAVLLLEKTRLHAMAEGVDDVALRASARFAALSLVVLPLLPAGSYGPFGAVRPRELWMLVLFFSGLSFLAWIARRLLGPGHGVVVAGLLGGIISSTSVTLSFARASRLGAESRRALALGTVGACTVMLLRVLLASAILNLPVARALAPHVWVSLAIGAAVLSAGWWRARDGGGEPPESSHSPLQLAAALQMTALFQIVLITVSAVMAWWSVRALLMTSAMIGLTDLDALTLSLSRTPGTDPSLAARALAVGVLSNTLLKLGVAVVVGQGAYQAWVGGALGVMAAAVAAAIWL